MTGRSNNGVGGGGAGYEIDSLNTIAFENSGASSILSNANALNTLIQRQTANSTSVRRDMSNPRGVTPGGY